MKFLLILLCCCGLVGRGLAQPGAFGGSLRFRLFDEQGRAVGPSRADYRCFPTWLADSLGSHVWQHPEEYPFATTIEWAAGYWRYRSARSPGGGHMPPHLTITIVHGRDTMRIQGLDRHFYNDQGLQLDSIPFLPGRFWVPGVYVGLLNVKAGQSRLANVGWPFFREGAEWPARMTAERLQVTGYNTVPESTEPASTCPRLRTPYDQATGTSAVYLAGEAGQPPKPLLRNFPGPILSAACEGRTLLLLMERGEWVLKSDDEGASWRVYQVRETARVQVAGEDVELGEFWLDRLRLHNGAALADGYREYYDEQGNRRPIAGRYQLHFDLRPAYPAYRRSEEKARQDVLAALTFARRPRPRVFLDNIRAAQRRAGNQTYQQRRTLRNCTLLGRLPELPLVLQQGQFRYGDIRWRLPNGQGFASGTYTFTDSTVTFHQSPNQPPAAASPYRQFQPSGTYYYYFAPHMGQTVLYLQRWDKTSDNGIYGFFELKSEGP